MNVFQLASLKFFQLFCVCLVLYLTYQQFLEYVKNQDSSSVSYRTFNEEEKDVYPTYSICLYSKDGAILNESRNYFKDKGKDGVENYHRILQGLNDTTKDFMEVEFDKNVIDILDGFVNLSVSHTRQGEIINEWQPPMNKELSPFYKSYQDPYFSCITKSSKFLKNQLLDYDYVILNSTNILQYMETSLNNAKDINMLVYIHYPGQLVKEFGKQILDLRLIDFKKAIDGAMKGTNKDNFRDVHLSHVEVLRKRSDGFATCNENLKNEDHLWLEKVISEIKCIPTYWKGLEDQLSLQLNSFSICNSSAYYDYVDLNFLPPNYFENGSRLYSGKGSCTQMRIMLSVSTKESPIASDDQRLIIGFRHARDEYRETINIKKFGKNNSDIQYDYRISHAIKIWKINI